MPLQPNTYLAVTWTFKSNQVIYSGESLFSVSFIEIAQVGHDIRCSQDLTSMAYRDPDLPSLTTSM